MAAVRYAALAALVVWLAGLLAIVFGDAIRQPLVSLACGFVVFASLVVIKFVGPPPRAFFVRTGIVVLMMIVAALALFAFVPAPTAVAVDLALGALLLFWYVYE